MKKKCTKSISIRRRKHLVESHSFHEKKKWFKLSCKILLLPVCGGIIEMPVVGLIPVTQRERSCIWILVGILALHDKAAVIDSTRG